MHAWVKRASARAAVNSCDSTGNTTEKMSPTPHSRALMAVNWWLVGTNLIYKHAHVQHNLQRTVAMY